MRASMAYFAGAGTVIAAIVAGVGGGLLIAEMISPKSPRQGTEVTRLERRMSPEPIAASDRPSEPVPYLNAHQPPTPGATVAAAPAPVQARTETISVSTPAPELPATRQPDAPASQPATPNAQLAAREQTAPPDDSFAKARDADVKRAEQKRRTERRQQWAEKRRQRQQELKAVEQEVREETESRQEFATEPVRMEMPRIRLFAPE